MPNIGSDSYLGELGFRKLLELIISELDKKQDAIEEMSAADVQRIWNEEMNNSTPEEGGGGVTDEPSEPEIVGVYFTASDPGVQYISVIDSEGTPNPADYATTCEKGQALTFKVRVEGDIDAVKSACDGKIIDHVNVIDTDNGTTLTQVNFDTEESIIITPNTDVHIKFEVVLTEA